MTRMTFEAISYAAFNKRYDAIGNAALPPFIAAMNVVLTDAMADQSRACRRSSIARPIASAMPRTRS